MESLICFFHLNIFSTKVLPNQIQSKNIFYKKLKIILLIKINNNNFVLLSTKKMINNKYGKLTVIGISPIKSGGNSAYLCLCDCGNEKVVRGTHLKQGLIKSCGCLYKQSGINKTKLIGKTSFPKEYKSWSSMKERCYNTNNAKYRRYGGRGIKVCDKWLNSFESFFEDMGKKPSFKHSIDRIDNNGDYEPSNCRWATNKQQANNRSSNRIIFFNGLTKSIGEWETFFNIKQGRLNYLIKKIGVEDSMKFYQSKRITNGITV